MKEKAPAWETGAAPDDNTDSLTPDLTRAQFLVALAALLDDHADKLAWIARTRGGELPDNYEPCDFRYRISRNRGTGRYSPPHMPLRRGVT